MTSVVLYNVGGWYNPHNTGEGHRAMIRLKIKEVAQQKGYSMSRLSRESNMAYKTIQTIWRDPYHEVTTTTLNKLARTLGVNPSELIEYLPE
jgi:DNA-binding Xre family transcriptional regulator